MNLGKSDGSIALITVIIVTAVLIAMGATLVLTSSDLATSTKNANNESKIGGMIHTCVEESLSRLKVNKTFTGTVTYQYDGQSCSALVENDLVDPNLKVLTVSGTTDGYSLSQTVNVDISVEPFYVSYSP